MIRFFTVISTALLCVACVNTDYLGKSYAPTTSVDIYYNVSDVTRSHEVMGKITAEAMEGWDSNAMVEELRKQAMAKGADAIVIENIHTEITGSTSTTTGKSSGKPEYVITKDGNVKTVSSKHSGDYSSTTSTVETREKIVDAELLKYQ